MCADSQSGQVNSHTHILTGEGIQQRQRPGDDHIHGGG